MKHNGRNDRLFFRDDEGGRARVTTDEERATARTLNGVEVMKVRRLGRLLVRTV